MINKTNARLFIPLIEAMAEGKTIQHMDCTGHWMDLDEVGYTKSPYRYRIKPEPRVFWILHDKNGMFIFCYSTEGAAKQGLARFTGGAMAPYTLIKVVEQL